MNTGEAKTMKGFRVLGRVAVLLIVIAIVTQEAEARRKILRGRKTVTRTYYKRAILPAWAIVLCAAIGELLFGGIVYFIMKKRIIDPPLHGTYSPPINIEA